MISKLYLQISIISALFISFFTLISLSYAGNTHLEIDLGQSVYEKEQNNIKRILGN